MITSAKLDRLDKYLSKSFSRVSRLQSTGDLTLILPMLGFLIMTASQVCQKTGDKKKSLTFPKLKIGFLSIHR